MYKLIDIYQFNIKLLKKTAISFEYILIFETMLQIYYNLK